MAGSGNISTQSVILPEAWLCAPCALSWPFHFGVRVNNFYFLQGLALAPNGDIYVSGFGNGGGRPNRVNKPRARKQWSQRAVQPGQWAWPLRATGTASWWWTAQPRN